MGQKKTLMMWDREVLLYHPDLYKNLGHIIRENCPLIWDRFTKGGELNDVPENNIWDAYS